MGFPEGVTPSSSLASSIDHTLLRADATEDDIKRLCEEAIENQFFSVCINPYWISLCKEILSASPVIVCSVVGFPLGATATLVKTTEARWCVEQGASEIDMVMAIGALKSKQFQMVESDIREVVKVAAPARVKVILETALLTHEEKRLACQIAVQAGAHFVKTSTGFAKAGANPADILLMRECVGDLLGVKASGGIRTHLDAEALIKAGASRLGTSAGPAIMNRQTQASEVY